MFSQVFVCASLLLAAVSQVNAHAAVAPVLGVAGTPVRADVQRPKTKAPCGKTDIASNIDTSTPIVAAADGSFSATVTNFNRRLDGSRQMTGVVDATGTGNSFNQDLTITQNGDRAPPELGSQQIQASLPAGTTCTGGASGNLCLVSFKSASGFGNCVVIQQSSGSNSTDSSSNVSNSTDTSTDASAATATDAAATDAAATDAAATDAAATDAAATDVASAAATDAAGLSDASGATATDAAAAAATDASGSTGSSSGLLGGLAGGKGRGSGIAGALGLKASGSRLARSYRSGEVNLKRDSNWIWA